MMIAGEEIVGLAVVVVAMVVVKATAMAVALEIVPAGAKVHLLGTMVHNQSAS